MPSKFTRPLWIVLTAVVVAFTAYSVVRNLVHMAQMAHQLRKLRQEAVLYRAQIEADSLLLEHLRYDDYLEEYARERFHMQRSDETVFRFE